ncbi:Alpha amylase, catalytic domain [Granulicella rosea]|uniref:Alpha amylase, catalytic domain n=1 Tax=Granulicella rosea TaxID=474952 RepID=A0A239HB91_9BACT|nr:alpha-amylase family glycosyl hydrolase [Granulicella rosea]SNS77524.1 Alpha amylase, catalytic domain [Granulicella rosea]
MEFHIARIVRERYNVDGALFSYTGNVVFGNLAASRALAARIHEVREREGASALESEQINAGALFAMGLIDELSHALMARYRATKDPQVLSAALAWFSAEANAEKVGELLATFTAQFPNSAIYQGKQTVAEWLTQTVEDLPNREAAVEELLLLWLANINPAYKPFKEFFDDRGLKSRTVYEKITQQFAPFFATRPLVDPEQGTLLDVLIAPMLASPDSLTGQLEFIQQHWAEHIGEELRRILLAIDVLKEEDIAIWMRFHPSSRHKHHDYEDPKWGSGGFEGDEFVGFGPGGKGGVFGPPTEAPVNEYEAFSPDQAWMPTVVLMAKSTYVWLEQLSKKYQRHIHRLDQIPDEELRLLASRGINGLWLIGLWERSNASQTIKRLRGQHDAVASAYSLKDYHIATDLGGEHAYAHLRDRSAAAGIRLASDMVPNHMGIDSNWLIEHPEWFLSRPDSPFPSYRFDGPDVSSDHRVEIKIEDKYYDQTDAAVVFRRRDRHSGHTDYVYHGNDGTTFAWNDTAQLNYSKAEVREVVMQTILQVARLFPIIRFDAAMTLAKKHVQRLWFPLPGAGGAIPSRAESAIPQAEFDALMPNEFWREVVDRVAVEVPGTLLLAEAFWLLEGYFVRTLGMHRVYNSAFMHMLRDEENAKYRSYLKKTIDFDPDILKRYVNFMSNPDERTAIDQFGDGDKYFGVATMLATIPGLPMFGHGQIEGFTEKYGMEYKRARMDEWPNEGLAARHQREIAPLLKNRALFAESVNFAMYDFWAGSTVDENVFAYSNRLGHQRAIVLFNNRYESTHGTIHGSVEYMDKGAGALRTRQLADALALPHEDSRILAYRDTVTNLEYLRRPSAFHEHGLTVSLRGYQYVVLQDWREFTSTAEQPWDALCDALRGEGVHDLWDALTTMRLRPLHESVRKLISHATLFHLSRSAAEEAVKPVAAGIEAAAQVDAKPVAEDAASAPEPAQAAEAADSGVANDLEMVTRAATAVLSISDKLGERTSKADLKADMEALALLPAHTAAFTAAWPPAARAFFPTAATLYDNRVWAPVLAWSTLRRLASKPADATAGFDRLRLRTVLAECFSERGLHGEDSWRAAARVRLLLSGMTPISKEFWRDPDVRWLAGVTEYKSVTYFAKESFEQLICWLHLPVLLVVKPGGAEMQGIFSMLEKVWAMAAEAGYEVDKFDAAVHAKPVPSAPGPVAELELEVAKSSR